MTGEPVVKDRFPTCNWCDRPVSFRRESRTDAPVLACTRHRSEYLAVLAWLRRQDQPTTVGQFIDTVAAMSDEEWATARLSLTRLIQREDIVRCVTWTSAQ